MIVAVENKTMGGMQGGAKTAAPPSYVEATAGSGPCYGGGYLDGGDMPTEFGWDDRNIRRVFIRKTLSMANMMAFVSSFYNTKSVMICLGITALVCLSVTIFSFQTKIDVTSCQGVLFILVMVLLYCGLFLIILLPFGYVPWLHAVYAALGAVVFTMFLAFDTQLLMGNRRYAMSPEEYIFAALNIYLDIVYIFSFFLQLFGSEQE
ncbi:Fas apoptotic inhibitory molecule 2-like [Scleropages formosus]|uniref:Protein lifeguard 2 n=1 Tax=Scleropages formosus TaxID=113540 RepID=A0A0P7USP3_SCLFO|nr:Fas apoptotic inhibitory molecule 2-like [Scleropages formosus]